MKLVKNVFVLMFVFYCFSNISVADESDKKQEVQPIQQEKQTEEKPKQTKLENTIKTPRQWCDYQASFFDNQISKWTSVYWFKVILATVITNEYENMKKYFFCKNERLNYNNCIQNCNILKNETMDYFGLKIDARKACNLECKDESLYAIEECKNFKQDVKYEQLYKKVNEENFNNLINFIGSADFGLKELSELGYSIKVIPSKSNLSFSPIEKQITLNTMHQKKQIYYCNNNENENYYNSEDNECKNKKEGYYYGDNNIESAKAYCETDLEIGYKQNKSKVRLKYIVLRIKDTESKSNYIIPLITEYGATKNLLSYMVVKDVSVKK